ncbi:EAL and HDOD domain-containing protein, partial [Oceanospirillum multiglobuliferum]
MNVINQDKTEQLGRFFAFARQPILSRHSEIVAYELLYRDHPEQQSSHFSNPLLATANVVVSGLIEQGIQLYANNSDCYINIPAEALPLAAEWIAPKERIVLEILEDVPASTDNIAHIIQLKEQGYRIALDDFILNDNTKALLPFADIIKIDLLAMDMPTIATHWAELKSYGAIMLAEKVETFEQWQSCVRQGFDLFQGYFFSKPENINGKTFHSSQAQIFQLLHQVCDPNVSINQLEQVIKQDPILYFRLMRYASNLCLKKEIKLQSVKQAVMMIGLTRLKAFLMLLSVTRMASQSDAAIGQMFIVASMTESAAADIDQLEADTGFLVGVLYSIANAMGKSLAGLLDELKLSTDIMNSLFSKPNNPGALSYQALAQCADRFSRQTCFMCTDCGARRNRMQHHYQNAIQWSDRLINTFTTR